MTDVSGLARELDDYVVADYDLPEDDEPIEAPPDADVANAMMRRRRRLLAEGSEVEQVAAAEIARITAWRDDRAAGIERQIARLDAALEQWTRAVNRLDPKRKTIKLPNGEAKLRASRERVVVADPTRFGLWQLGAAIELVAAYLADGGPIEDERPQAEELVVRFLTELVFPLGRITIQPDRQAMAKLTKGPQVRDDDDETAHALLDDGSPIPGVEVVKAKADTFSVTGAAIPEPPAEIE